MFVNVVYSDISMDLVAFFFFSAEAQCYKELLEQRRHGSINAVTDQNNDNEKMMI